MKKISTLLLAIISIKSIGQNYINIKFEQDSCFNSVISYPYANTLSGNNPVNYVAAFWTGGGNPGAWRSFFKVNLNQLPLNATIDSAFFSLYADPNSLWGIPGSPNYGNDNEALICRITSTYNNNAINWYNQPSFTFFNASHINQSSNTIQNYNRIESTNLIKDVIASGNNEGFAIVLKNEVNYYNSQIFASCSHPDESKRPSLIIYYSISFPNSLSNSLSDNFVECFCLNENGLINFNKTKIDFIEIINLNSQIVYHQEINNSNEKNTIQHNLIPGLYIVKVVANHQQYFFKHIFN